MSAPIDPTDPTDLPDPRAALLAWGRAELDARMADLAAAKDGGFTLAEVQDRARNRTRGSGYTAPEVTPVHACGTVDGREVVTAPVIDAHGRDIHCADGTGYTLGEPDPDYVAAVERARGAR